MSNHKKRNAIPKELRRQFSRAKYALRERLIEEQSLKEAKGGLAFEGKLPSLFKRLNIEDIFTNGIYRKVGNKTIHLIGTEAVVEQIRSLKQRASKKAQKRIFIENYIKSMETTGFTRAEQREVELLLNKLSADKISILLDKGVIKEIAFVYSAYGGKEYEYQETMNKIRSGLRSGISDKEYKEIKTRARELKEESVKPRFKILSRL